MKNKNALLFVLINILLFTQSATAQEIKDHRLVIIKNKQTLLKVEVAVFPYTDFLHPKRRYTSYESDQIFEMEGAVRAHPLHGTYQKFDLSNNLLSEGTFIDGLKSGGWKEWNKKGILMNHYCWKEGILDGEFREYNNAGNLIRSGKYRKGKLHGKIFVYNKDGLVQTLRYKKGNPIAPKTKKSKKSKKETSKTPATGG